MLHQLTRPISDARSLFWVWYPRMLTQKVMCQFPFFSLYFVNDKQLKGFIINCRNYQDTTDRIYNRFYENTSNLKHCIFQAFQHCIN